MENQPMKPHVLVVIFPGQGHLNPALQLAHRLLSAGIHVTFSTTPAAQSTIPKSSLHPSLSFSPFSDGNPGGATAPVQDYMSYIRRHGSQSLRQVIADSLTSSSPFTCVCYSLLLPWAASLAAEFNLPSVLFWSQSAAVFSAYYHYFNGFGDEIRKNVTDPSFVLRLPGLPPLSSRDLPSFFVPSEANQYAFALPLVEEHLQILDRETNPSPRVIVNSFDKLELDALKSISKYNLIAVGPLLKLPAESQPSGSSVCQQWLNSKPNCSVIYISFGTITDVSERQMEEVGKALKFSGRPFLWVIREELKGKLAKIERERLEEKGLVVGWCDQLEVLSNPALGCFLTHCGWNSTTESLACGVPVVAFPQWTDQLTNAKLVQDYWKIGVRVQENEEGVVAAEEILRCLDMVMGDSHGEIRENAKKWKVLANNAIMEGGSSLKSLQDFVSSISGVN